MYKGLDSQVFPIQPHPSTIPSFFQEASKIASLQDSLCLDENKTGIRQFETLKSFGRKT